MKRSRTSAGLLMFRRREAGIEVLLAHPGGPFFRKKDNGFWTIPKGEVPEGEDFLARARIEFEEEVGVAPSGDWIELGWTIQKGGKTVHAWAFEGNLDAKFKPTSNTFVMQWPPHSGKIEQFPEIDQVQFFSIERAKHKIKAAQGVFLDRLGQALELRESRTFR
jgi:predicted NUDIX family NTP pyrophosphohydrolase